MRAVFADPKTDFVFKRIFGTEAHKPLLIELLNALLELDEPHRIVDLKYLTPEQHVPIEEMKLSLVDVKCTDQTGRTFVVEMQVLNVEGFEKRVVYNAAKAYVTQLRTADDYPILADVVGVTICDFKVWPETEPPVPMLSHWRMQEQHGGALSLPQIQHVFLELPKYRAGLEPVTLIDKWAYFFREAENFQLIPPVLAAGPFREALEVARIAGFDAFALDYYDKAKMAEQDARGALSLALREGEERGEKRGIQKGRKEGIEEGLKLGREEGLKLGREEGLKESHLSAIRTACTLLAIPLGTEQERQLAELGLAELEALRDRLLQDRRWPG